MQLYLQMDPVHVSRHFINHLSSLLIFKETTGAEIMQKIPIKTDAVFFFNHENEAK